MTNEDVIQLAELNKKLNSFNEISNAKQVFAGIRDERDPIIDRIISGEDIYIQINGLAIEMSQYYFKTYGEKIDFTYFIDFIEQIIRILLKNLKLYDDVEKPRAFMASYLFKQKFGTFDNRVKVYFNKYYPKYFERFKGHKSLEQLFDKQTYNQDDLDYWESNKFYADYHEFAVNSMDNREKDGSKNIINNTSVKIDLDDIEDDEILYLKDEDILLIPDDEEGRATVENSIIRKYDIDFEKIRIKNIALTDEEYNKEIDKSRNNKINSWHKYNAETGYFPHNITKYQKGINYFLLRDNKDERKKIRENKETGLICAICKPAPDFDFKEIFFDKTFETYLKNIIIKNLSPRQQLLIRCLYYQMMPVDNVVSLMGFSSSEALDTEKSRSLILLKYQILSDFDYIIAEYGNTKLAYWAKKIKQRHEKNICEKKGKKVI